MKSDKLLDSLIAAVADVGAIAVSTLDMLLAVLDDFGDDVAGYIGERDRIIGVVVFHHPLDGVRLHSNRLIDLEHLAAGETENGQRESTPTPSRKRMSGGTRVVCVTGASGYIASWLVKLLLQRGYTVKATVRDPSDSKKTEHLLSLDGAKERLHLFKADLLEEGSFDTVVDGCQGVFHTASPVQLSVTDPQAELVEPAVKGTLNVLKSCAKFPTVKRVVLTSSMASVLVNGKPLTSDVVLDETWYSDPLVCEKNERWYALSKTLAEEAAWKYAKENGIDLVTMNPGFVIGPLLQPTLNLSVEMIQNLITGTGTKTLPLSNYRSIDVRDVVSAHILAFEVPSASGRYCLVSNVTHASEVLKIIQDLYPTLHLPEKCEIGSTSDPKYPISAEKAKASGYIGSWLVKLLLQRSYTVIATVRDPNDPNKRRHLLSLDGAKERLHLFKAGLLEEGAFDPVIDGCVGVFHTASPVQLSATDPQIHLFVSRTSGERGVVCVTGAAGYIASWLVKLLLQRGYTVRATVRDPSDPKKTEHLLSLDGAKERLHLFRAELLEEGSFDTVVDGCQGVFHTASPVQFSVTDPQAELVEPAVKGTLNVLKSCAKFPTVKRVVLTSSMASVSVNGKPLTSDVVLDETWYSDPLVCEKNERWYALSKTLAEEAAWKYAKESGIDLVTMNPGFVIGPLLQPTLNLTVEMIQNLITGTGTKTLPLSNYRSIDVRDVVSAHILAFEVHSASGRYCLVSSVTHASEVLKIIQDLYPTLHLPEKCEIGSTSDPKYPVSAEKAKGLGINFLPLEVSLRDTIESLKEKGFLKI
ncbi:unnamed protein product [Malus baccata var. baccata]